MSRSSNNSGSRTATNDGGTNNSSPSFGASSTRSYYVDPLISIINHAIVALATPPHGASGLDNAAASGGTAPQLDVMAAFACLTAATTMRVLPTDGAVYGCPVCLFTSKDWCEFEAHRRRTHHARVACLACGGQDGRHTDKFCTAGFNGALWAKEDFVVPRAEFTPPCIPQYHCTFCAAVFSSAAVAAGHARLMHGERAARPRQLPRLPRRHFSRYDPGVARRQAHEPKRVGRLLYQCPECLFIFSSWSQWEHHVRVTKHSQPYCVDCSKILGKFLTEGGGHTELTGHLRIVGEQPTKETHLRLIDSANSRYRGCIDTPEAQSAFNPGDVMQIVLQCPVSECTKIFPTAEAFAEHVAETRHGVTMCSLCATEVRPIDHEIADHPHAIPELSHELWFLRDPTESCAVEIRESAMLAYYAPQVVRCGACSKVIFRELMNAHRGSDECIAIRGLRAAAWEHHDRVKQHRAVREQRDQPPLSASSSQQQHALATHSRGVSYSADVNHFATAALFAGAQRHRSHHHNPQAPSGYVGMTTGSAPNGVVAMSGGAFVTSGHHAYVPAPPGGFLANSTPHAALPGGTMPSFLIANADGTFTPVMAGPPTTIMAAAPAAMTTESGGATPAPPPQYMCLLEPPNPASANDNTDATAGAFPRIVGGYSGFPAGLPAEDGPTSGKGPYPVAVDFKQ